MATAPSVNVIVLFALVFALAGNVYLFLRYKVQIELTDEVLEALQRAHKERDDMGKTIEAIHKMYQHELGKQRELFARYYGENRREGGG